jgi:hypothetical protein
MPAADRTGDFSVSVREFRPHVLRRQRALIVDHEFGCRDSFGFTAQRSFGRIRHPPNAKVVRRSVPRTGGGICRMSQFPAACLCFPRSAGYVP